MSISGYFFLIEEAMRRMETDKGWSKSTGDMKHWLMQARLCSAFGQAQLQTMNVPIAALPSEE